MVDYDIETEVYNSTSYDKDRKNLLVWGGWGVGKTYFALTAPKPIFYIDLDFGGKEALKFAKDNNPDAKIYHLKCRESTSTEPVYNKVDKGTGFISDPVMTMNLVEEKLNAVINKYNESGGTIVIDDISSFSKEVNRWVKMSQSKITDSGKDYVVRFDWSKAGDKYTTFLHKLQECKLNVICIAKSKEQYSGSEATGIQVANCPDNTQYAFDNVLNLTKAVSEGEIKRQITFGKSRGHGDIDDKPIIAPTWDKVVAKMKTGEKL